LFARTAERRLTAAHVFQEVADAAKSKAAIRHGRSELSYTDLAFLAGNVAAWLRDHGVGRGDIVATLLDRSPHCVVAVMGIWAAGAAYVHIEPADPDTRVAALLAATDARAVIADERNRARLPADGPPVYGPDRDASPTPYEVGAGLGPDDTAYLVFTSGSTGVPKAVEVQHRALLNYCDAFWARVAPTTLHSFGVTTTFAADIGKASIYAALLSGARLDIYDRDTTLDPIAFATELRAHPVDALTYVPSQLEALASVGELADLLPDKLVELIGEPFPPRLAAAMLRARPHLEIYNGYGPAEATIAATMHRVEPRDTARPRVPVGTPIDGVTAHVLDQDLMPVPDGTPGILYLGGVCLARGYRGDAALTDAKFRTDTGVRLYRTDDLVVRHPEGWLDYLGRADRQLKIRGNRVEPGEVENALLALPGVRQALVTGERSGPEEPLELVAYVAPAEGAALDPDELTGMLFGRLPRALVPSRISVVPAILRNENGKADLAALRAAAADAADRPAGDRPRPGTEQLIGDVWTRVLDRTGIGRNDRFLEVGGNSFKALTVFAHLRREFPGLSIAQLYDHATIAEIAAALDGAEQRPEPCDDVTVVEL
jgi:amino acid adenylation domain-containing protein